jgi:hypothetical protein
VLEALQEAAGRATARHKQLVANLKRTDDNLVGALEEAERIRVGHSIAILFFGGGGVTSGYFHC